HLAAHQAADLQLPHAAAVGADRQDAGGGVDRQVADLDVGQRVAAGPHPVEGRAAGGGQAQHAGGAAHVEHVVGGVGEAVLVRGDGVGEADRQVGGDVLPGGGGGGRVEVVDVVVPQDAARGDGVDDVRVGRVDDHLRDDDRADAGRRDVQPVGGPQRGRRRRD